MDARKLRNLASVFSLCILLLLSPAAAFAVESQHAHGRQLAHEADPAPQADSVPGTVPAEEHVREENVQGEHVSQEEEAVSEEEVVQEEPYKVYVNGEQIPFEQPPILENDNILVEFRTIFESLGYQIDWNNDTKTAIGTKDGIHIEFPVGKSEAVVNGETKTLPVLTRIVNGRTMIPLRFVSEESGYAVDWDPEARSIHITRELAEEHIALASNLTLNGFIEVSGAVSEQVTYIRLDISHADSPQEIENIFLEPVDSVVHESIPLSDGPGIYKIQVFVTTSEEQYGSYRLLDTYKVAFAENADLMIIPDEADPNRYIVRARLSDEAESAVLQIKKLDREALMIVYLEKAESQQMIEEEVYLPFGSGVYQFNLFEIYDGNQSIQTATLTHQGNTGLALSAETTRNSQVEISGTVSPDMRWMWVQYANPSQSLIRNAFVPVEDGKVKQTLHLNMGKGLYQITIAFTTEESPYNNEYTTYETHEVENLDTRNRYLLPSENVESHAEAITRLANQITGDLESNAEKSQAIYDWLVSNISYDVEASQDSGERSRTAVEALKLRSADSTGFARLNAALHRAAGIPVKIVSGEVLVGEEWRYHLWNEVYVGDRWTVQDAASDAVDSGDEANDGASEPKREYFDPDANAFAQDHKKDRDTME